MNIKILPTSILIILCFTLQILIAGHYIEENCNRKAQATSDSLSIEMIQLKNEVDSLKLSNVKKDSLLNHYADWIDAFSLNYPWIDKDIKEQISPVE